MAAVDGLLGEPEPSHHHVAYGGRAVRSQRHQLLPVLHAIQDRVGWVSRGALEYACRRLSIPPAEAYGVVSFYARFALQPRGPLTLRVCDDIVCKLWGADEICSAVGAERSPCLGLCDHAPAALVERSGSPYEEMQVAPISLELAAKILQGGAWPDAPRRDEPRSAGQLLRRAGVYDPESLESYRAHGGFA